MKSENEPKNENGPEPEADPQTAAVCAGAAPQALLTLIGQQNFFKGLTPRQLGALADTALVMEYEAGQQIFREGDLANRFYIILKGSVVLESEGVEGRMIPIQTIGKGEDLGWSWLFLPFYLHFSARAVEPTKALFFYGARVRQLCEEDHELGYELMKRVGQVLVQRLEAMRSKLLESTARERLDR